MSFSYRNINSCISCANLP